MESDRTGRQGLPLQGIRVLEFCHTIMGPCCTMMLADLGAEVIKIEPVEGERTRQLGGFGAGYFAFFNRNKRSFAVNLKDAAGRALVEDLITRSDVLVENFAPGTMARLGLGYEAVAAINGRLIYCSLKGFLPGPYAERAALDETVQMMSGLAYMTGPAGRPLRAGASVVDMMGGMFGVLAISMALRQRDQSNRGQLVESGLFETAAFLMGQHLAYTAVTKMPVQPMPERVSAWAIYELFDTVDGQQVFIGIVSDAQWVRFCKVFGLPELLEDESLADNNKRIAARSRLLLLLNGIFGRLSLEEALRLAAAADLAYAPVSKPGDLVHDSHLQSTGSLLSTVLGDGSRALLPRLPMMMNHRGFGLRNSPPAVGADTAALLQELGVGGRMQSLRDKGVVGGPLNVPQPAAAAKPAEESLAKAM
jgi:crotonobetainyl-CoA:carnitine CoA-transferase CaiB-like acyl-CoA transferase